MARKQSSTIWFEGEKHKEIWFDGSYHDKMYLTDEVGKPTLVWEKLNDGPSIKDFTEDFWWTMDASESIFYCYSRFSLSQIDLASTGGCAAYGDEAPMFGGFATADFVIWSDEPFEITFQRNGGVKAQEFGLCTKYNTQSFSAWSNGEYYGTWGNWKVTFSGEGPHRIHIKTKPTTSVRKLVLIGESNATGLYGNAPRIEELPYDTTWTKYYGMSRVEKTVWDNSTKEFLLHPQLQFCCPLVTTVRDDLLAKQSENTSARWMFMGAGLVSVPDTLFAPMRYLRDATGCFAYCQKLSNVQNIFYFNSLLQYLDFVFFNALNGASGNVLGLGDVNAVTNLYYAFAYSKVKTTSPIGSALNGLLGNYTCNNSTPMGSEKGARVAYYNYYRTLYAMTHQAVFQAENNLYTSNSTFSRYFIPRGIRHMYQQSWIEEILPQDFAGAAAGTLETDLYMTEVFRWCTHLNYVYPLWNETYSYTMYPDNTFILCENVPGWNQAPHSWGGPI